MKVEEYLLLFHELGRSKTSVSDLSLTPVLFLLLFRKSGDFFKKKQEKSINQTLFFQKNHLIQTPQNLEQYISKEKEIMMKQANKSKNRQNYITIRTTFVILINRSQNYISHPRISTKVPATLVFSAKVSQISNLTLSCIPLFWNNKLKTHCFSSCDLF